MNFSRAYEIGSWGALDSKVPPRGTCRHCGKRIPTARHWCQACLNWEKSEERRAESDRNFEIYRTTPHASVCSLGKNRFFWCVLAAPGSREAKTRADAMLASGYAATRDEARAAVKAACPIFLARQNQIAASVHHEISVRKHRANAKPNNKIKESVGIEYLYTFYEDPDGQMPSDWSQHRVIKKTKKRVWLYQYPYDPESLPNSPEDWRLFSFDREELEQKGGVFRNWQFYYTEEGMRRHKEEQAEREAQWRRQWAERGYTNGGSGQGAHANCFTILGLSFDCTQKDVKRAFRRKSREVHPDNGGSHEAFIELRQAYEQAMRLCSGDKVATP